MVAYITGLGARMSPLPALVIRTIDDLGVMVVGMIGSWSVGKWNGNGDGDSGRGGFHCCSVTEGEIRW